MQNDPYDAISALRQAIDQLKSERDALIGRTQSYLGAIADLRKIIADLTVESDNLRERIEDLERGASRYGTIPIKGDK